jgi:hypothetical protein
MRSVLALLVLPAVALTIVVAGPANAGAHPRLTHCTATADSISGAGVALFVGTCNGKKTKLRILPFKVTGKVGGLPVKFKREGARFSGTVGKAYGTFVFRGHSITGSFARHPLRFTVHRTALWGHIGTLRVGCTVKPLAPLGERIACTGKQGGAAVLVPELALLYAAA